MKPRHSAAMLTVLVLAGCTPWATYPPIEGAVSLDHPQLEPIPSLMAEAIGSVYEADESRGELIINLPPGTSAKVYDRVIAKLGGGRPMQREGERAYHVYELRIRGTEAEVDAIHPGNGGAPELLTLTFKQDLFSGWEVERVRRWRIRVEAPPPHYVSPAEESASTDEAPAIREAQPQPEGEYYYEAPAEEEFGPPYPAGGSGRTTAPPADAVTHPT